MINWLKKYFIPHRGNDHKPHFLRTEIAVFVLAFIFLAEIIYLVPIVGIFSRSNYFANILSSVLVDSANSDRQRLNAVSLRVNPVLAQAAQLKANDMASKGYFAHTSPTGVTPWYWFDQAGYKYVRAGENLAVNFNDSSLLHQAWMNSPTHRANIVNGYYSEVGIASANGMYKGREAIFVAQLFGQPAKAATVKPVVVKTTPVPTKTPIRTLVPTRTPILTPTPLVAVQKVEAASTSLALTSADDVKPAAGNDEVKNSSFMERVVSQPKTIADDLTKLAMLAILAALCLAAFVRIEFQSARLVTNGLIILIVLGGILIANQHFAVADAFIF